MNTPVPTITTLGGVVRKGILLTAWKLTTVCGVYFKRRSSGVDTPIMKPSCSPGEYHHRISAKTGPLSAPETQANALRNLWLYHEDTFWDGRLLSPRSENISKENANGENA